MPYWFEKKRIPVGQDKRVKLTDEHRAEIKLYRSTGWSMRKLARHFEVDRRLIQFVIYPERQEKAREKRDWRNFYTKEKQAAYMRKFRQHQKDIFGLKGK